MNIKSNEPKKEVAELFDVVNDGTIVLISME